jgi:hypothetical protein
MSYLLEVCHEHALSVDFAMFVLIWIVQLIVYPVFLKIEDRLFVPWHRSYCNRIGLFVLPLMFLQLIEAASSSFFIGDMLAWLKLIGVLGAWIVTFLVSAPCHRKLAKDGMQTQVVERLIRTNWLRTFFWSFVFIISFLQY